MGIMINGESFTTLSDYMNDETKVSTSEKAEIEFETEIIQKKLDTTASL